MNIDLFIVFRNRSAYRMTNPRLKGDFYRA